MDTTDSLAQLIICLSTLCIFFSLFCVASKTILQPSTKFFNSLGSKEDAWSGPLAFLFNVKCFSIILAPKATAPIEVYIEEV